MFRIDRDRVYFTPRPPVRVECIAKMNCSIMYGTPIIQATITPFVVPSTVCEPSLLCLTAMMILLRPFGVLGISLNRRLSSGYRFLSSLIETQVTKERA